MYMLVHTIKLCRSPAYSFAQIPFEFKLDFERELARAKLIFMSRQ